MSVFVLSLCFSLLLRTRPRPGPGSRKTNRQGTRVTNGFNPMCPDFSVHRTRPWHIFDPCHPAFDPLNNRGDLKPPCSDWIPRAYVRPCDDLRLHLCNKPALLYELLGLSLATINNEAKGGGLERFPYLRLEEARFPEGAAGDCCPKLNFVPQDGGTDRPAIRGGEDVSPVTTPRGRALCVPGCCWEESKPRAAGALLPPAPLAPCAAAAAAAARICSW